MKKLLVLVLAVLVALSVFSCSPSPTAMEVGGHKIDASEYAYYLHYNGLNLSMQSQDAAMLGGEELLENARAQAEEQIANAEVIRLQCAALGLELSDTVKKQLKADKEALVESFGGTAGYLSFLRDNAMTDRLYDKLQENSQYYSMLYEYVTEDPDGVVQSDQALRQFFSENYVKVKYIRLSTLDETGTLRPASELDALYTLAEDILAQIQAGTLDFDYAVAQYNDDALMTDRPTGIVLNVQGGAVAEYADDAAELQEGAVGGIYTYSDGYYILQRLTVDANYFDENREQIALSAGDWAFQTYVSQALASTTVNVHSVCRKIDFSNLTDYIK